MYFETRKKALELGINSHICNKIEKEVKKEFPNDDMMYELHLLRALINYSEKKGPI
jgi:hypothetical protein